MIRDWGIDAKPRIMIPLIGHAAELSKLRDICGRVRAARHPCRP